MKADSVENIGRVASALTVVLGFATCVLLVYMAFFWLGNAGVVDFEAIKGYPIYKLQ